MLFLEQGKIGTENGKAWVESLTSENLFTTDKTGTPVRRLGRLFLFVRQKTAFPPGYHTK